MATILKNDLILFFFVLFLTGIPGASSALPIEHDDGNVLPMEDGDDSLDTIDFSELSESSLLKEAGFRETTTKNTISMDSMSDKDNYLLDEINDEYESKQIKNDVLKGKYGKVNSERTSNRISNRNMPDEKVDFNIDSLGEDFDVEQTLEKVVDKVKNKANNLMLISKQPNNDTADAVSTNGYKQSKYLQDDNFDREIFNETFKWTIIYLIIGLISLKLIIKMFSVIGSRKSKRRRRHRRRHR